MNKTIGFIYALWNGIALLVVNILLSNLLSVDIYCLFFVETIMFLALIWYKINVDDNKDLNVEDLIKRIKEKYEIN